jgi:hypothetical protein
MGPCEVLSSTPGATGSYSYLCGSASSLSGGSRGICAMHHSCESRPTAVLRDLPVRFRLQLLHRHPQHRVFEALHLDIPEPEAGDGRDEGEAKDRAARPAGELDDAAGSPAARISLSRGGSRASPATEASMQRMCRLSRVLRAISPVGNGLLGVPSRPCRLTHCDAASMRSRSWP